MMLGASAVADLLASAESISGKRPTSRCIGYAPPGSVLNAIRLVIRDAGPAGIRASEVARALGRESVSEIGTQLVKLVERGHATRPKRGLYIACEATS